MLKHCRSASSSLLLFAATRLGAEVYTNRDPPVSESTQRQRRARSSERGRFKFTAAGQPSVDLTDDGERNAFRRHRADVDAHRTVKP